MRLFRFKASHGLLACKGTQKDVGSLTSWSTFHLVNDIKSPTAFLIHIWCLWTNWGRRIQERISINAWFHKFDPNFYCLRTQQISACRRRSAKEARAFGSAHSLRRSKSGTKEVSTRRQAGDHFSKENTRETILARKTHRRAGEKRGKQHQRLKMTSKTYFWVTAAWRDGNFANKEYKKPAQKKISPVWVVSV